MFNSIGFSAHCMGATSNSQGAEAFAGLAGCFLGSSPSLVPSSDIPSKSDGPRFDGDSFSRNSSPTCGLSGFVSAKPKAVVNSVADVFIAPRAGNSLPLKAESPKDVDLESSGTDWCKMSAQHQKNEQVWDGGLGRKEGRGTIGDGTTGVALGGLVMAVACGLQNHFATK